MERSRLKLETEPQRQPAATVEKDIQWREEVLRTVPLKCPRVTRTSMRMLGQSKGWKCIYGGLFRNSEGPERYLRNQR